MDNLVFRLTQAAIYFDKEEQHYLAKLLTEAIEEIENARLVRSTPDEGAKQSGHAD